MRKSVCLAAVLGAMLVAGPASAKADEPKVFGDLFVVDWPELPAPPAVPAKRNKPLLEGVLQPARVVELDGSVGSEQALQVSATAISSLDKGALVYLVDPSTHTYCSTIHNDGLAKSGPCVVDADNDGRFESVVRVLSQAVKPDTLAIADNGKIMGVNYRARVQLPEAIAYHAAAGPIRTIPTSLYWQSDFKKNKPGPVKISFWFDASNNWAGTGLASEPVSVTYTGEPIDLAIAGLTLTVKSVTAKGELEYVLAGRPDHVPLAFRFFSRAGMILIYY